MYLSGASTTNTPSSFYTHFQCCTKCEVAQHPTLLLHLARAIIGTDRAESTSCAVPINHTSDGHARRCDVKPDTRVIRPKLRTHSAWQPTHRAPSTGRRPAAPRRAHATAILSRRVVIFHQSAWPARAVERPSRGVWGGERETERDRGGRLSSSPIPLTVRAPPRVASTRTSVTRCQRGARACSASCRQTPAPAARRRPSRTSLAWAGAAGR